MEDLTITIVQNGLHWEDKEKNRRMFSEKLGSLKEPGDIVFLPEMFTTGFSMSSGRLAETNDGPTMAWMREEAKKSGAAIAGSFIAREGDNHYNRMVWMQPDGSFATYDKRHLFRFASETEYYSPGTERRIVEWKGWRIQLSVCFDLRFPVWLRNREDHDVLLCNANWPEPRRNAWQTLLKARAIENQVYVAGVNRVGQDGKGLRYAGDSAVIDPKGNPISQTEPYEENIETVRLSWEELVRFREKFPIHMEADRFALLVEEEAGPQAAGD